MDGGLDKKFVIVQSALERGYKFKAAAMLLPYSLHI